MTGHASTASGENATIRVSITFRNIEGTDPIRAYASDKLSHAVGKFIRHEMELHLVLKVEKSRQIAEVSFRSEGTHFKATEESDSLYSAIDKIADNVAEQLRRHKDKITSHHKS